MDLGLSDRVALVTAASRGLGRAAALALLAEGVRVVAVARGAEALEALAAEAPPGRCLALPGDVEDPALPARAVAAAVEHFGRLDILVANTAGPPARQPMEATEAEMEAAFRTVFFPAVRLVRAAVPKIARGGWGRIVLISSTSVKAPKPFLCLSAAARSALWAWAKSAAPELQAQGITLNNLLPGPHDTDRARDLGARREGIGRPEDFGTLVAMLCADATRFVAGTTLVVDGGETRAAL